MRIRIAPAALTIAALLGLNGAPTFASPPPKSVDKASANKEKPADKAIPTGDWCKDGKKGKNCKQAPEVKKPTKE